MIRCLVFVLILLPLSVFAQPSIHELRTLSPSQETIREDLGFILKEAKLEGAIDFTYEAADVNESKIICTKDKVTVDVKGDQAWGQTLYMSLQRLGFLFPHPRMQISPSLADVRKKCGKSYKWNPAVKYSGFHFHTLHPNEWVQGFLLGKTEIAIATVRWLARNQQNIFDLSLLAMKNEVIFANLKEPFNLAKNLGIHAGVALGLALHQQRSYKLISLWATLFDSFSKKQLKTNLETLLKNLDLSFVNAEPGTSEFTAVNYPRAIEWMNLAAEITKKYNVALVMKVHTSSNQHDLKYGNFNFLPKYADAGVGILPHTVFLYGLEDEDAPMYGNKNFRNILDFMTQEKDKRRTWFYPETSYYLGLDIDAPLLLTDYLLTRAKDTKLLHKLGIEGQLNFSTGQEIGYWLFDWTYTLVNNADYDFDPAIGIKLLGENAEMWNKLIAYQHKHFINKGLISIITFPNFGDELMPKLHQVLKRNLVEFLHSDEKTLDAEIANLNDAIANLPEDVEIQHSELKNMWEITRLRIHNALNTRLAIKNRDKKEYFLNEADKFQKLAQKEVDQIFSNHTRYPEAQLFERFKNPTAYQFGYGYTVRNLHYWEREKESIRQGNFSPFFMGLYSIMELINGWVL